LGTSRQTTGFPAQFRLCAASRELPTATRMNPCPSVFAGRGAAGAYDSRLWDNYRFI
jgi:hypothetical protein